MGVAAKDVNPAAHLLNEVPLSGQACQLGEPGSHTCGIWEGAGPDELFLSDSVHHDPQFTSSEVAQLGKPVHGLLIALPAVYLLERRLSRPLFERRVPGWINVGAVGGIDGLRP